MSLIVGEKLVFGQGDGSQIRLTVFGDEHYARYEKEEGWSVVYDASRQKFCYADVSGGRYVSTGVSALEGPPPRLRRHLQESNSVRAEKRSRSRLAPARGHFEAAPSGANFSFGPSAGLLGGRRLSVGRVTGLTILVNFRDVTSTVTRADVDALLNSDDYTRNGNVCSAREYFRRVSSGKLDYTNVVVGPYTLSQPRQYYVDNLLVREAVDLAVAAGLDLKRFDSLNQGIVDALNVLYAGQTQYLGELWPHNFNLDLQYGNVRTDLYLLTSMGRTADDLSIGTFCHENGHLLCRFPDMYDYGNREGDDVESEGIGSYCLMGSGNHNANGRVPSPVCGYLRELAGWCDVVDVDHPGEYEAHQGDYSKVLKFRTPRPNEYFIVENRTRLAMDTGLPASGLAVYHCDILGSNEFQAGTADRHYQCALLQADGRRDLERNVNRGDGSDLFGATAGLALSSATNPSTRMWDGSDSGLKISVVGAPGEVIRFTVGDLEEPTTDAIRAQATPALAIPDNNPSGVSSKLTLAAHGSVQRLAVAVDVTHTWIGDLVVELVSPSGRKAMLHNGTGGSQHNLVATYSTADNPGLAALVGEPIEGPWTLRVADKAAADTGKLNKWSIEIAASAPVEPLRADVAPNLAIPDNSTAGIWSVLAFTHTGVTRRVRAIVDIAHPWVGDLNVELVSPNGRRAVLHAQTGGSADDLRETYDSDTPASALATLVGQPISGNWTLRVSDRAARDAGTLKSWSLELLPG